MDYSDALKAAQRSGKRIARDGWNGKGMYVLAADRGTFSVDAKVMGDLGPFLVIRTAQGTFVPWLCSQTDALASDWFIMVTEGS